MSATSPASSKDALRAAALARREDFRVADREAASRALASHGDCLAVRSGTVVAGYMPMRGEIDPRPLMQALQARGARLALPAVVARDAPLIFRAWRADDTLIPGPHDTCHPPDSAPQVAPDIVLVPLAAFDRRGHRIGYGGVNSARTGAALRAARPLTAVGVAFAVQEVETVPASPHDALLDLVLTDVEAIDLRS